MFSNLDRKRTRTFGIDDLFEAYKENFNGHPGLKDEYRKLLAYISPSGEINSEDFYNLMNNEKLFRNDFY